MFILMYVNTKRYGEQIKQIKVEEHTNGKSRQISARQKVTNGLNGHTFRTGPRTLR